MPFFFDIGRSAGRSLCLAARFPIRKCIGVEYNTQIAAVVNANIAVMRGRRADIEIHIGDGVQTDYLDGTAFYLYNPVGWRTMSAMIDAIGASLVISPRETRIVYAMPEFEAPLASCAG